MNKRILNEQPSPRDDRDFLAEALEAAPIVNLPLELDLRSGLQPIRNQGSQGTCAAQTAACMKEWQEKLDINFKEHMSPQFVYNNRENKKTEGMYGRNVMEILSKVGSVPEKMYPYLTTDTITASLKITAKRFKISGYAKIRSINDLKKALVKNGPCYISVPCFNWGIRMWKKSSIKEEQIGGHAMTCVGYLKEGFIIRNSWGAGFGDKGYCIFPYNDWGCQWDVWTTIDASSTKQFRKRLKPKTEADPKRGLVDWFWDTIRQLLGLD